MSCNMRVMSRINEFLSLDIVTVITDDRNTNICITENDIKNAIADDRLRAHYFLTVS